MELRPARQQGRHEGYSHAGSNIAHHAVQAGGIGYFCLRNTVHDKYGQWQEYERLTYPLIDLVPQNIPGPGVQVHSRIAKKRHAAYEASENHHPPGVPTLTQHVADHRHANCRGNPPRTGPEAGRFGSPAKQFLHEQGQRHEAAIEHKPQHRYDRDTDCERSVPEERKLDKRLRCLQFAKYECRQHDGRGDGKRFDEARAEPVVFLPFI